LFLNRFSMWNAKSQRDQDFSRHDLRLLCLVALDGVIDRMGFGVFESNPKSAVDLRSSKWVLRVPGPQPSRRSGRNSGQQRQHERQHSEPITEINLSYIWPMPRGIASITAKATAIRCLVEPIVFDLFFFNWHVSASLRFFGTAGIDAYCIRRKKHLSGYDWLREIAKRNAKYFANNGLERYQTRNQGHLNIQQLNLVARKT
jgi:hypothetical protein